MQARNESEVARYFNNILKNTVDYMVQKIWNENREIVRQIVYEAYQPTTYNRTGEFQNAWSTEVSSNGSGHVKGTFFYDPDKLTVGWPATDPESPQYGQHASAIDNVAMTTYLADVIYEGLAATGGGAFGHGVKDGAWAQKRDAWSALLKKVGKQRISDLFVEGMNKQGFDVRKHKIAIGVF